MAHGFSGTMDWIVPDFADKFAAGGLAVLIFDYRYLGSSGGEPRQLIDSRTQREDLRRAVQFARTSPGIDASRIAVWGTSLGGSHVVNCAANDSDIAAVVANVPGLDLFRGTRGRFKSASFQPGKAQVAAATIRLLAAALLDAARGTVGLSPYYIPVYGPLGKAVFSDPARRPLPAGRAERAVVAQSSDPALLVHRTALPRRHDRANQCPVVGHIGPRRRGDFERVREGEGCTGCVSRDS
jgi:uncharacterized protein